MRTFSFFDKRTADVSPALPAETSIADIGRYIDAGYAVLPCEGAADNEGHSHNSLAEQNHVAVACGAQRMGDGQYVVGPAKTWVVALRINVVSDAELVREIEAVIKPRLRFGPMSRGRAPVRFDSETVGLLMPFALTGCSPLQVDPDLWASPDDHGSPFRIEFNQAGASSRASVTLSAVGSFVASGCRWRSTLLGSAVDLRVVPRDELPLISAAEGVELLAAILAHVEARPQIPQAVTAPSSDAARLARAGLRIAPYPVDNIDAALNQRARR